MIELLVALGFVALGVGVLLFIATETHRDR